MAEGAIRPVDRIDIAPRFTAADAHRLNNLFRGRDTTEMLRVLLRERMLGDVALVSSFGAESAVLLHLVMQADPTTPVLFLETGKHFPETLAYRDLLAARFGIRDLRNLIPDADVLVARDAQGERWSYDPDGCCDLRKVQPLAKALARFDASITGRKAFQAATRASLPRFEIDASDAMGRIKLNPLATWSPEDIASYVAAHDLPPHPLVAEGYPSIGCAPCTARVAAGDDPRSGRWKGWDKTECGIHLPTGDPRP